MEEETAQVSSVPRAAGKPWRNIELVLRL